MRSWRELCRWLKNGQRPGMAWLRDGDGFISIVAVVRPVQLRVASYPLSYSLESETAESLVHAHSRTSRTFARDVFRNARPTWWRIEEMFRLPVDVILWLVAPRHLLWRLLARLQNESRRDRESGGVGAVEVSLVRIISKLSQETLATIGKQSPLGFSREDGKA